jgi:hypothetical protein
MGKVHFLNGKSTHPCDEDDKKSALCPSCIREISTFTTNDGKKVCPFCKELLPLPTINKLEDKK